ncbi:MAG: hypothetical protein QF741_02695 [Candidatus Peribacteraceae bacterium]|jgi:hypothetical protein|nr:hypothetical protein [Candidatus Peribacteraceae bacterium]MDP7454552.1 hypothetical protein [Candidatus Peribacteraceae bacterium]MDP7646395.1 hypothetical protein [Candidatus Peribacteraceae bacterium]|tara:strand:+ start:52 stop:486 length:435 start_codon:yes stop_codon:yes gene_type:complete
MNPQKVASQSQKSGPARRSPQGAGGSASNSGSDPFNKITEMEKKEAERTKKEIDAMEKEKIEVEKAVTDKTVTAEEGLKSQANEELKGFKADECSQILSKAQELAEEECKELEATWKQKKGVVVANLVSDMTNPDSPILKELQK